MSPKSNNGLFSLKPMIAKYCIFCTSLCGDVLDFQNFLLFIPIKLEILKEIATAKNALLKFYCMWAVLL